MVDEPRVDNRSIQICESAIGSAIVSGDGNTVYVIHQTFERRYEPNTAESKPKIGENPYKGLAAFKEKDSDRYFGREEQVNRLWKRFQALYQQSKVPRVLPILGPSGCGKSSLTRAGLIPELARRPLPEKEQMRVAVLVPGTHPVEALAGVLARVVTNDPTALEKTAEFERVLEKTDAAGEFDGLRRITSQIASIHDSPLVLLVDQFEEIYSLCDNIKSRQVFVENLLHAANHPTGNVSIILTLRSDFLGETQQHPQLNDVIGSDQSVIVPAMRPAELRRAIVEPARLAGHPLDEAVVELLVKDTQGREGALPLLQFALTRIWEGMNIGQHTTDIYWEMGGVGGALAGKAQEIYDKLSDVEKDITRRVFIKLIQPGEGTRDTRRRVLLKNLTGNHGVLEMVKRVINQFSSPHARLITLAGEEHGEIVEVTHEALFNNWELLKDWLNDSREDRLFQRRLDETVTYWDESKRPRGTLWRHPDLDLLQRFYQRSEDEMTPLQIEFYQESIRVTKQNTFLRLVAVGALVVISGVTSLLAINAWRAEKRAVALQLAAQSEWIAQQSPDLYTASARAISFLSTSECDRVSGYTQSWRV